MDHYPVFLNLQEQHCLVIGAGKVARRKVQSLLQAGAHITLISPNCNPELRAIIRQYSDQCDYLPRTFQSSDLDEQSHYRLVVAATDDRAVNKQVATLAKQHKRLVSVADSQSESSFIFPSVVNRQPVCIAISTGGASPVLARQLRMRLETIIPSTYGQLARLTARYRKRVKQLIKSPEQRRYLWEDTLNGPCAELAYAGNIQAAEQWLEERLLQPQETRPVGEVYLVGAGPGDPDLLTFRAYRLIQQADVVLYDRLVARSILEMTRQNAERIYVGKARADHSVPQQSINELLVELALQGKRVLRLKGGDPFIFGRGGEEIETLAEKGIPFQVVPGVTAAAGCASYAGIPLTHRDYAHSCTFATGHLKDGTINLDWQHLTQPQQTLVFYMSLTGIRIISEQLIRHGMQPDLPAALIEQGTTRRQRVHVGTLATLADLVESRNIQAPTLTIVGKVVKLHEKLQWYQPERHVTASEFSNNINIHHS